MFTPLTSNLDQNADDVLPSMYYILISELLVTPFLRWADLSGNFQRHILAPRAMTQQEMNLNFLGTRYRLGERFTVRRVVVPQQANGIGLILIICALSIDRP